MLRWIFCAALVLATAAGASAQPAKPDLAEAASLYRAAEQAMTERRYDDAARDYGAAYEISKDAVLFFKIGSALDKGGKCPVAVTYYRRYLREAKPTAEHQKLTNERIAVCEGTRKPEGGADAGGASGEKVGDKAGDKPKGEADKSGEKKPEGAKPTEQVKPSSASGEGAAGPGTGGTGGGTTGSTGTTGTAGTTTGTGTAEPMPATATPAPAGDGGAPTADNAAPSATGELSPLDTAAQGAALADVPPPQTEIAEPTPEVANQEVPEGSAAASSYPPPPLRRTAGWLAVGGGIAFVTIGAVLALSAESTEDDLADFYIVRTGGDPLPFNGSTQRRYDELVERGERYQTLAWVSFGVAAAAGAAATYFFLSSRNEEQREPSAVALRPLLSPQSAGLGASWGF